MRWDPVTVTAYQWEELNLGYDTRLWTRHCFLPLPHQCPNGWALMAPPALLLQAGASPGGLAGLWW